jgi:hypothetical protein
VSRKQSASFFLLRTRTDYCSPKHLKIVCPEAISSAFMLDLIRKHFKNSNVHMTFPFIASSSCSSPTEGTGTPHVKSLVTAVGRNPPFILGSTISPLAKMTALLAHLPFSRVSCKNVSNRDCKASSRRQEWVDGFVESLWFLFRLQRGCKSSVGEEKVPAH